MKLFSLKDQIAFVTGAGSGIGQGIASASPKPAPTSRCSTASAARDSRTPTRPSRTGPRR